MIEIEIDLSPDQIALLEQTDPKAWFTRFKFRNASSPVHPHARLLDENNELKRRLIGDWIKKVVPGKRVLDLFCANGGFSFLCALAGATSVVGIDYEAPRIDCAKLIASFLQGSYQSTELRFEVGDVYNLKSRFKEPFDVVLALGGLYHIADPPYVLRQIRALTKEWLIVQTSSIMTGWGNRAKFIIREDQTSEGLSSITGGDGVWRYTSECFETMLRHGGFKIVEWRRPSRGRQRKRFPWYAALARPAYGQEHR